MLYAEPVTPIPSGRLYLTDSEWMALRYIRWLGPCTPEAVWMDTRLEFSKAMKTVVALKRYGLVEQISVGPDVVRVTDDGRDAVDLCGK